MQSIVCLSAINLFDLSDRNLYASDQSRSEENLRENHRENRVEKNEQIEYWHDRAGR